MKVWRYRKLNLIDQSRLVEFRKSSDLWFGVDVDSLWIRYPLDASDALEVETQLNRLPCQQVWDSSANGMLCPIGFTVPTSKIPEVNWKRVRDVFHLTAPTVRRATEFRPKAKIALARSGLIRETAALMCEARDLIRWLESSLEIEFQGLNYAASSSGKAFIIGKSIPPITGSTYWRSGSIFAPAGFEFEFKLTDRALPGTLHLKQGDLALFDSTGNVEIIAAGLIHPLSRQSARASFKQIQTTGEMR